MNYWVKDIRHKIYVRTLTYSIVDILSVLDSFSRIEKRNSKENQPSVLIIYKDQSDRNIYSMKKNILEYRETIFSSPDISYIGGLPFSNYPIPTIMFIRNINDILMEDDHNVDTIIRYGESNNENYENINYQCMVTISRHQPKDTILISNIDII